MLQNTGHSLKLTIFPLIYWHFKTAFQIYSRLPLIRSPFPPNNSVLIRETREHHIHSQYFLPRISFISRRVPSLDRVLLRQGSLTWSWCGNHIWDDVGQRSHLTLTPGSDVGPCIVYVLPDPVWPYARMHTLYPSIQDVMIGFTSSNTCHKNKKELKVMW